MSPMIVKKRREPRTKQVQMRLTMAELDRLIEHYNATADREAWASFSDWLRVTLLKAATKK